MPLKREDAVYAEGFRFSQEGHAVWPKILSSEMKPGACGYFNGDGDWVTIVQLTDIEAVKEILGLTSAATAETAPDAEAANRAPLNTTGVESVNTAPNLTSLKDIKVTDIGGSTDWSEKISTKIRRQALDLHGAVIPPGAAAGAKAGIQYTCMASRGAVLVARPPVSCARLFTESDLINWVNNNIEALVHKGYWPSIKKRGLWVIRKTYHAPECAKSVFQAKDENVTLHVGAKVPNIGDATASAAWWNAEHVDSGWTVQRAKDKSMEESKESAQPKQKDPKIWDKFSNLVGPRKDEPKVDDKEDNLGVVIFFGGIWWRKRRFLSRKWKITEEQKKQEVLGEEPDEPLSVFCEDLQVTASDSEEAFLELAPVVVGEGLPSDGLPTCNDTFEMYEEDDEEEE